MTKTKPQKPQNITGKLQLMILLPLAVISALVIGFTYKGLQENASSLTTALKIQAKAKEIVSLNLRQDDFSKAMLLEPKMLDRFSEKKLEAYDRYSTLIAEIKALEPNAEILATIDKIYKIDDTKLKPLDTLILETLFEDIEEARHIYFQEYVPVRQGYEQEINKLAELSASHAMSSYKDMKNKNDFSLIQVSVALIIGLLAVFGLIQSLGTKIEVSQRNMMSLLGSLNEGLFFFDRHGNIAAEKSQALENILPGSADIRSMPEFLERYANVPPKQFEGFAKLLWQESQSDFFSDLDTTFLMLPSSISRLHEGHTQYVEFHYQPVYSHGDEGEIERVVVTVDDITERLQNEHQLRTQAERVRKISRAAAHTSVFVQFGEEMNRITAAVKVELEKDSSAIDEPSLKRDLHTLKGSLSSYEFKHLAHEIHLLEDLLSEYNWRDNIDSIRTAYQTIESDWQFELEDIYSVLGLSQERRYIKVEKSKVLALQGYAQREPSHPLHNMIMDVDREPPQVLFQKFTHLLDELSQRFEDKDAKLAFIEDSAPLSLGEAQSLDSVLGHLIRNGVDHGIETRDIRQAKNKPPEGTLKLATRRQESGGITLELEDDGAGIDGEYLAEKAVEKGLWTLEQQQNATESQKQELIFMTGLSSKSNVTDVSGRGVGMDAVLDIIKGFGGSITVNSIPNIGTKFFIKLPPGYHLESGDLQKTDSQNDKTTPMVMIIDDDLDICMYIESTLESYSYDVSYFTNYKSAIENFSRINPDIVITDYKMPIADGDEITKMLRNECGFAGPVICITGSFKQIASKDVFDLIFTKPFDHDEIARAIAGLLKKQALKKSA